jgi:hypothetical protein
MRILTIPVLALLLACGGSDTPSEGDMACKELAAKLAECHLTTRGVCNTGEPCGVRCAAMATCSQLTDAKASGSYLSCIRACSGAGPDDFVCADQRQFLNKSGVCDGRFQCLDGSDEADCGASGDAGSP